MITYFIPTTFASFLNPTLSEGQWVNNYSTHMVKSVFTNILCSYLLFNTLHLFSLWAFYRLPESNYSNFLITICTCCSLTPFLFDLTFPTFSNAEYKSNRDCIRLRYLVAYLISTPFYLLDWVEWWIRWPYPTLFLILITISLDYMYIILR